MPAPTARRLQLVKPYQGMVAWNTVFVAIAIVAAFALVTTLATMRIIPLWLGLILNSFILYLDQTPLHEACHGNIAGRDSKFLWLNHLVGFVCGALLLHEYKAFRYMHLAHHRDTNNPDIDPDHWVAVRESVPGAVPLLHHRVVVPPVFLEAHRLPCAHPRHAPAHPAHRRHVHDLLFGRLLALGVRLVARGAGACGSCRISSPRR